MPRERKQMRRAALGGIVALMVFVAACGGRSGPNPDLAAMERGDVLVKVENRHGPPITLYGLDSGTKFRIGLARSGTSSFWVRRGRFAGQSTVHYLLQPTGTRGTEVYTEMDRFPWGAYRYKLRGDPTVTDSDVVTIRLMPELGYSYIRSIGR